MTWKQLKKQIKLMDKEQLNSDVTVYLTKNDEYFKVVDHVHCECNGVLDNFHPFLLINA